MTTLRWERAEGERPQQTLFDEPIFERQPGRGEFRGIEFLHVRAQRVINEVKGAPFGFRFTINPYRGCTHACSYCLHGETAILMADGRTKPLAEVRAGDRVYGTVRSGAYRRYVTTEVVDHWSTVKRAYRVTLEDGTALVASGDHRFLTERGWKHVTGTEQGVDRRPHLTTSNSLMGVGGFAPSGKDGPDYRLGVAAIEPLGIDLPMFDITTGTGDFIANGVVSHNCFARPTHTYLDLDADRDFESRIVVKVNAVSHLRSELDPRRWRGDLIAMGTNTDPYQRAEGKYRLTRGLVEVLTEFANPFSILTKSTLILRDLELLARAARTTSVRVNLSIGTLDEEVWRATEPGTPHPRRRVRAVEQLNEAGIPCGVLIAPVLPGLSDGDDQLDDVVSACVAAGARSISSVLLHLRPGVREVYLGRLAESHPHLVADTRRLYRDRAYAPKADQQALATRVRELVRAHGGISAERGDPEHMAGPAAARPDPPAARPVVVTGPGRSRPTTPPPPEVDQLSLL